MIAERTTRLARYASLAMLFGLAACSAESSSVGIPSAARSPGASTGASFTFTVPAKAASSSHQRRPEYISASTQSVAISVNGATPPIVANLAAGSPSCPSATAPTTCSIFVPAPIGADTFVATFYDAIQAAGQPLQGHPLSTSSVSATITQSVANTVNLTFNGIPAALSVSLSNSAPTAGTATVITLSANTLDAGGNVIVGPGSYADALGNPLTLMLRDNDASGATGLFLPSGTVCPTTAPVTLATSLALTAPALICAAYSGSAGLTSATFTANVPLSPSILVATATLTPVVPQIVVDTANGGPSISQDLLGSNLPAWTDNTQPYIATAMANAGLHLVRWPGGSFADDYHWENGGSACNGAYFYPSSTFDAMMTSVAVPDHLDVAITLDYGSNAACTGPGDPLEAKAWVGYAKSQGYNVRYWTVGNEDYGSWENDLHALPNDPGTYASAVAGSGGYYTDIKAADPTAKVGIVVGGPTYWGNWDQTVLRQAAGSYDFVEFHYYAQQGAPNQPESDSYLLGQGVTDFANSLQSLRAEMTASGVPTTIPIYLGELNSIVTTAGKQTVSITNGLFAGMAIAEAMKQPGVTMATWWLGFGDCETSGNMSSSLYGWQNFGSYTLFSDASSGCGSESSIPAGTPFPTGRAYALLSQFAGTGSVVRNVTLTSSVQNTRVYADTLGSGYGILLFNLSETVPATYLVQLANTTQNQFIGTQIVYDKAQYDQSQNNVWAPPTSSSLGIVGTAFSVTLPPWSMNLVNLQPK